jgi:hypothetical protein
MKRLHPLDTHKLSIVDLGGLSQETIIAGKAIELQLGPLGIKALNVLIETDDAFRSRLILVKGSPITLQIQNADVLRDDRLSESWRTSSAAAKSSIDVTAAAGKVLVTFLRPYRNAQKEPLMSETSIINFMQEKYVANQEVQDAATMLQLDTVFTTLFTANTEVSILWNQRANEDAGNSRPSPSSLKRDLEKSYRNFCDVVLQTLNLSPTTQLENLFVVLNGIRIKYAKFLPVRITDLNTTAAPIPTQKYTGNAITPIPTVFLKINDGNFKEMKFSVDFYITYRNNVKVGEAKIIIHGKGKYKGTYTTSFHIEH